MKLPQKHSRAPFQFFKLKYSRDTGPVLYKVLTRALVAAARRGEVVASYAPLFRCCCRSAWYWLTDALRLLGARSAVPPLSRCSSPRS